MSKPDAKEGGQSEAQREDKPFDDDAKGRLQEEVLQDADLKIILLGDSAVGKSKLIERYLMDAYVPRQLSTYALTLFRKDVEIRGKTYKIDFWDTAGQERFDNMHPSYYYGAHAVILCFDVTRKQTYQHLTDWYKELREYCETQPCQIIANKIDIDPRVVNKNFKFAGRNNLDLTFASAADGTNVVQLFEKAIDQAIEYKATPGNDFISDVNDFLKEESPLEAKSS